MKTGFEKIVVISLHTYNLLYRLYQVFKYLNRSKDIYKNVIKTTMIIFHELWSNLQILFSLHCHYGVVHISEKKYWHRNIFKFVYTCIKTSISESYCTLKLTAILHNGLWRSGPTGTLHCLCRAQHWNVKWYLKQASHITRHNGSQVLNFYRYKDFYECIATKAGMVKLVYL